MTVFEYFLQGYSEAFIVKNGRVIWDQVAWRDRSKKIWISRGVFVRKNGIIDRVEKGRLVDPETQISLIKQYKIWE